MKAIEALHRIELSESEINIIVNALHVEYMTIKNSKPENQEESRKAYMRMQPIRELRNDLASLINRFYMGEDA